MSTDDITPKFCRGACCRNPFGVCHCKRKCTFHQTEEAKRAERETWQAFRAELDRAGSVSSHKMTQRNKRG